MVFVGRRAFLSPEDLLARLAVGFDLVGLLFVFLFFVFLFFVFLFFGMAAVYHCDRPVVCDVPDKSISRRFPGFLGEPRLPLETRRYRSPLFPSSMEY